jgi:hypothetical protein
MSVRFSILATLVATLLMSSLQAQETQVVYLSGTGFDQTVEWDFYCSDGINSGKWTTIQVPSCWVFLQLEQSLKKQKSLVHNLVNIITRSEG